MDRDLVSAVPLPRPSSRAGGAKEASIGLGRRPRAASVLLAVVLLGTIAALPAAGQESASAQQQLKFGIRMAERGLWSEARFRFLRADELQPSSPAVLNNLAVASEALGLFDEALGYYRSALELDPDNKVLRRNYSRFVEFYQAFRPEKPDAEEPGSATDGEATAGDTDAEESTAETSGETVE